MPESLPTILDELEAIAEYDGPWLKLRNERKLLRTRIKELREREARFEDVLIIALVGGSGVGKSTLLNALAGDQLARTSELRPCTSVPTIYHPPGAVLDLPDCERVSGSALEHLIIVDTPDSDTILREHRERTVEVLKKCDLVLVCGSPTKYLDEATWSLLRPLQGERAFVLIETKAEPGRSIRDHWEQRIQQQGFTPAAYFSVQALRALDRKLNALPASPEELDFPRLEDFLRHELTRERIARIKRSNAAGLLAKTITRLRERVEEAQGPLNELQLQLNTASHDLNAQALEILQERLFAESHLWSHALNREIGLRAKGFTISLYNIVNLIRAIPARLSGTAPSLLSVTRRVSPALPGMTAEPAAPPTLFAEDLATATDEIAALYFTRQADIALAFTRAGLTPTAPEPGLLAYRDTLAQHVAQLLRGPIRDTILQRARLLTSWPATAFADALPVLFLLYAGMRLLRDYFFGFFQQGFIGYTLAVLALLTLAELTTLAALARFLAHDARRSALQQLQLALLNLPAAFQPEQELLHEAQDIRNRIERLANELT